MSFADLLNADRDAVFLNTAELAEQIQYFSFVSDGVYAPQTLTVVFVEDRLEGTNQLDGDGPAPEDKRGGRVRFSGRLWLSADVVTSARDYIIRADGSRWNVKRKDAEDEAMQVLLMNSVDRHSTRQSRVQF